MLSLSAVLFAELTESQRSWLAEHDNTVRVAYNGSFVPLSSVDLDGEAVGIVPDFFRWMADRYNFNVEFFPTTIDQKMEGLASGEYDVGWFVRKNRDADRLVFTSRLMELNTYVFVKKDSRFKTLKDLNGAVVALESGDDLLMGKGIDFQPLRRETLETMLKDVAEGRADALVSCSRPVYYLSNLSNGSAKFRPIGDALVQGEVCLGVYKENDVLFSILEQAVGESSREGVVRWIDRKWFGSEYQSVGSYVLRYSRYVIAGVIILLLALFIFLAWDVHLTRHIHKKTEQLRASEERLRTIFQNSPDAIFIEDESGTILDANPVACDFHGLAHEEIVGQCVFNLVPEAQRNEVKKYFPKWFTGELRRYEGVSLNGDGQSTPVEVIGAPLRYEGKSAVLLMVRDMTERKRSERALKESEMRYRGLVETQNSLIARIDADGRLTFVNESFCRFLGRSRGELIGSFFHPHVYHNDLDQLQTIIKTLIDKELNSDITEYRIRAKHHIAWVRWEATPIFDGSGSVVEIQIVGQDVTESRRINEALKESERRLRFLFEEIPHIAVQGYNSDHEVIFWNRASELLYGYPREEALGKKIETLVIPPNRRAEMAQSIDAWVKTGQPVPAGEMIKCRADGQPVPVYASRLATWNRHNEREMYVIDIDLTEIKRASEELVKAKEFAERANRAKSEFLANMSHEIRTPMNGVMGMTNLLLDTGLDSGQRDLAQTIMESTQELLAIIDELLDISRIEAGEVRLQLEPFCPRETVEKVILLFRERAGKKGIDLSVEVHPDVPRKMMGDSGRIRQVLINLIGNSLKFTHAGQIRVRLRAEKIPNGWNLLADVKDTGIGMSPDLQKKVFDKFSQGDTSSTREHGGAGLGLAITKQLIELMGGKISVSSTEGRGTTFAFNVILPALQDENLNPESEKQATAQAQAGGEVQFNAEVLLVEDNLVNQKVATAMIKKLGPNVTVAANGAEALKILPNRKFDLIFMDCQMPIMDGFETTRAIRQMVGELRDIPIVAMTAHALKEDRQKCLDVGMDDYIAKPVHREKLVTVLHKYCS